MRPGTDATRSFDEPIVYVVCMEEKPKKGKQSHPLLDAFWYLSSTEEHARLNGVKRILTIVCAAQSRYKAVSSLGSSKAQKQNQQQTLLEPFLKSINRNEEYSPELDYALYRLVRGLGASEDTTRLAFSTALSEVCHSLDLCSFIL